MFESLSLFLGAFFDALIGSNFFVPGEPFLLAAGFQLYNGMITGTLMVLLGGLFGDQLSYLLGHLYGKSAQRGLIHWQPKSKRLFARCRYLMATKDIYIISFARLLGPIAWIVPFMAGMQNIAWRRFSFFSSIGLVLGVGQFVIFGYLLAAGVDKFTFFDNFILFLNEHKLSLIAVVATIFIAWLGYRLKWKRLLVKVGMLFILSKIAVNYAHYFWYADDFVDTTPSAEITPVSLNYKTYPGKSAVYDDAQGINVLFVGESPKYMMTRLGWLENKTFSRNSLSLLDYIDLIREKTPPVSDLFWNGRPQNLAFQLPGDLLRRSHIRWWLAGREKKTQQPVWIGALSYDDGLKLSLYAGIVTVLHEIEPNIDKERDKLANQISKQFSELSMEYYQATEPSNPDDNHDYYSDGRVLLIYEQVNIAQNHL